MLDQDSRRLAALMAVLAYAGNLSLEELEKLDEEALAKLEEEAMAHLEGAVEAEPMVEAEPVPSPTRLAEEKPVDTTQINVVPAAPVKARSRKKGRGKR